jgi:hypothetical protein
MSVKESAEWPPAGKDRDFARKGLKRERAQGI